MTEPVQSKAVDRRVLLKGAAWSVPVLVAAVAVPAASASTPSCPTCIKPGVLVGGAWTSQALVVGNSATLAFANLFTLNAVDCGLITNICQPAFTFVVTAATLTMSSPNGNTTATYNSTVGLDVGAGVLGAAGALPGAFAFTNVALANGLYPGNARVRPTKLSVTVSVTLKYGLGLTLLCPFTLEWNLNGISAGAVVSGAGTVNFSGTASAA